MKIGVVVGTFDLFHIGHLRLLERAASHCDRLIVGVNRDAVVERDKKKTPIISENDGLQIVSAVRYVSDAFFVDDNAVKFIKDLIDKKYNPTIYFRGDETHKKHILKENKMICDLSVEVFMFPYTDSISSSKIREKLNKQQ